MGRPVSRRGERSYLKAAKEVLDEESTLSLLPFVNSFSTDNPLEARRVFGYAELRRASTWRDLQTVIYFCFASSHAGCMTQELCDVDLLDPRLRGILIPSRIN